MAMLTIEDLIRKKEELKPVRAKRIHVDLLGGELELRRLPLTEYWDMINRVDPEDQAGLLQKEIDMIYAFCPALHDHHLQEAFGVDVPTDIVPAVLGEDLSAIAAVVGEISSMYGYAEDETKN